jgi:hypothetical protein
MSRSQTRPQRKGTGAGASLGLPGERGKVEILRCVGF